MIQATIAMAAMALLFVVFGVFALADGKASCGGNCGTCAGECELDLDGRRS